MNDLIPFLLDIIKLIVAGSVVFFIAWSLIKNEVANKNKLKLIDLRTKTLETTLPLRLQAYERLVLFIERINPSSLLVRSHVSGLTVLEMQHILITDIRNEYQHNITQQIYVSNSSWEVIKRLKEDTISMINNASKSLPHDANSVELSKVILTHLANMEDSPYDQALMIVKSDLHQLF